MTKIHTFTFKGNDIDITYNNGFIAYTFTKDGKNYGSKVKLASHSVMDVMSATFLIVTNAIETMDAL